MKEEAFVIQGSRFPLLSKFAQAIFPLTSQHDVLEYEIERRTFTRVPNAIALEIVTTLFFAHIVGVAILATIMPLWHFHYL